MFEGFGKIARLTRECVITEKIDGTNAQVFIEHAAIADPDVPWLATSSDGLKIAAGSRTQWVTPRTDNHGFARWVDAHVSQLFMLGPGRHFGEWWGSGIQRGYGLQKGEKRFSLFNVNRWGEHRDTTKYPNPEPACCHVVPLLYRGMFNTADIDNTIEKLRQYGSYAVPGFKRPEGIIIFHTASGQLFKKTLERDEEPKGMVRK